MLFVIGLFCLLIVCFTVACDYFDLLVLLADLIVMLLWLYLFVYCGCFGVVLDYGLNC